MARRKTSSENEAKETSQREETRSRSVARTGDTLQNSVLTTRVVPILAVIFLVIWALNGLLLFPSLFLNFKRVGFTEAFTSPTEAPEATASTTEATLPGIGRVNIACVQQALSPESLQKVIQERGLGSLTQEERTRFEACITSREEASPTPTPAS